MSEFDCRRATIVLAGGSTVRGSCPCGWTGPARLYTSAARTDIRHHLDGATGSD
jgi:hypothetical protein